MVITPTSYLFKLHQNEVMLVRCSLTNFRKKANIYYWGVNLGLKLVDFIYEC